VTPATLGDSDLLDVGEEGVAVGAPFGLESTVTTGVVSALNRPVTTQGNASGQATIFPAIQTDAAINPGNSGGPLINLSGEVVGIDSAIRTDSSSVGGGGGSIGLGFAIPINDAIPIVEQLRDGEQATHALIGVSVGDAQDELGLPSGAVVGEVTPGSAAAESDLRPGDVIAAVDEHQIADSDTLVAIVRTYRPGDTVTLTVTSENGDEEREVKLTLGSDAD
jgi:putative serine protease PepD